MKRLLIVLMTLVFGMVAVYAKPTLDGNKIYLDEANTSLFTAEQFIANVGGEEVLDVVDEAGHTKRMQLELLTNPNKVLVFATEELANVYYTETVNLMNTLSVEDLYCSATDHYESFDFWLFLTLTNNATRDLVNSTTAYIGE